MWIKRGVGREGGVFIYKCSLGYMCSVSARDDGFFYGICNTDFWKMLICRPWTKSSRLTFILWVEVSGTADNVCVV